MLGAVQLLLRRVVARVAPAFDRDAWRDMQAAALPLGFFMIALNTYTYIDTVILGLMRTDAEVGWYAASYRVYEGLTYAPSILAAVLTPRLSYSLHATIGRRIASLLTRALVASLALGVVLGGVAALAAAPIIALLFGSRYAPAVRAAADSVGRRAVRLRDVDSSRRRDLDQPRSPPPGDDRSSGSGANVALNIVLIPRYGISGAAWATVLAEGLTVVLLLVQIERRLRRP